MCEAEVQIPVLKKWHFCVVLFLGRLVCPSVILYFFFSYYTLLLIVPVQEVYKPVDQTTLSNFFSKLFYNFFYKF